MISFRGRFWITFLMFCVPLVALAVISALAVVIANWRDVAWTWP
jgi:hypothetical protein